MTCTSAPRSDQAREVVLEVARERAARGGRSRCGSPAPRAPPRPRRATSAERPRAPARAGSSALRLRATRHAAPPRRGRPPRSPPPRRRRPRGWSRRAAASSAFRSATLPASSAITTSWSCLMWGVAQIGVMPSASASRAMATESSRSSAPSSSAGRMWQWRSITPGAGGHSTGERSGTTITGTPVPCMSSRETLRTVGWPSGPPTARQPSTSRSNSAAASAMAAAGRPSSTRRATCPLHSARAWSPRPRGVARRHSQGSWRLAPRRAPRGSRRGRR